MRGGRAGGACRASDSLPQATGRRVVVGLVQGVDLAQGPEPALQVIDDGPRHESLGAIRAHSGPKMDVMVDGRLLVGAICEV